MSKGAATPRGWVLLELALFAWVVALGVAALGLFAGMALAAGLDSAFSVLLLAVRR